MANDHNQFSSSLTNVKTSKPNSYVISDSIQKLKTNHNHHHHHHHQQHQQPQFNQTETSTLAQLNNNNKTLSSREQEITGNISNQAEKCLNTSSSPPPPPVVYGELSILGYNGYIPNIERNGRRNKSKFLLCKRTKPNGIKKSRHYIVKTQPQTTKAIQDKDLHSISYTFSRAQTIIVEYRQDENTDMFQIGRSSEEPIDFVVMDTVAAMESTNHGASGHNKSSSSSSSHHHNSHPNPNNVPTPAYHELRRIREAEQRYQERRLLALNRIGLMHPNLGEVANVMSDGNGRFRDQAKDGEANPNLTGESSSMNRNNNNMHYQQQQAQQQSILLNYPQPNLSNLPASMMDYLRYHQESPMIFQQQAHLSMPHHGQSSSMQHQNHLTPLANIQPVLHPTTIQQMLNIGMNLNNNHSNSTNNNLINTDHNQQPSSSNRHNLNSSKNATSSSNNKNNSHTTQSTISRFACRILVDRNPPYTARIYAAGFDSSKNIFLGEKATKWEQDNTIDGLTTNGVLLMHPKKSAFHINSDEKTTSVEISSSNTSHKQNHANLNEISTKQSSGDNNRDNIELDEQNCSIGKPERNSVSNKTTRKRQGIASNSEQNESYKSVGDEEVVMNELSNDSNDICMKTDEIKPENRKQEIGGVWREVSVDGGIYAIRESRSAAQKGVRIEDESNVLQDGTLIDLCGATLLWRSVEGFKSSPTKKSLEEKIDMLNATRPQCPVGLNTLVIPRKPLIPAIHQPQSKSHHKDSSHKDRSSHKSSHQPYVYLKCGHVQGYHDWGVSDNSNQRTCPICRSVGIAAKLSMGLEPSFYVDSGPLTHVFNPCGHMASEKTVKYWSSIKIPHGTHFFHSICPFCATHSATNEPPSTKLIFQDDLD